MPLPKALPFNPSQQHCPPSRASPCRCPRHSSEINVLQVGLIEKPNANENLVLFSEQFRALRNTGSGALYF